MLRHAALVVVITLVGGSAAAASINHVEDAALSCPPMPVTTLSIFQVCPSNPDYDSQFDWYFSLCSYGTNSECYSNSHGYVIQIDTAGTCQQSFKYKSGNWTVKHGGLNTVYEATGEGYLAPHYANVTLLCDPTATTPVADGNVVLTFVTPSGAVPINYYAIRIKTSSACPATPSPPTPPPTPAPIPNSARVAWSVNVGVSPTGHAPGMVLTGGILVAQTDNFTAASVTGVEPGTGQMLFQSNDQSDQHRRTGLDEGDGTGLFFEQLMLTSPNSFMPAPAVAAYSINGGGMRWNSPLPAWSTTAPRYFKGSVYAGGVDTMHILDASSGRFLAGRRNGEGACSSNTKTISYSFTDRHGVTTDVIIYAWGRPTTAFNVTDPVNPTQLWNTTKSADGNPLTGSLFVTPDQKTVFMVSSDSEGQQDTSIGAFDSMTGTLDAAFAPSILNVPYTTVPFAASNTALFAVSTVGLPGEGQNNVTMLAYSRADGSVLWQTELAPFSISSTCSFEPVNATMVCAVNSAGQYGSFLGVQLVKIDPATGAILWQATLPASEGSIHAGDRYKPLVVGTDSVVVLWSGAEPNSDKGQFPSDEPYSLRRLDFVTG